MGNFNKVFLMGNITRDIELRTITSGTQVAKVGLAVNRRWVGQDGQRKEETTFVDCEAWGKTAENIAKFFAKGRPIFIEGRLKLDQWQDKESGQNRSKLGVVIEGFEFVDSRPGGAGGGEGGNASGDYQGNAGSRPAPTVKTTVNRPPASAPADPQPDDIPF